MSMSSLTIISSTGLNHINYPTTAGFDVLEEERGFSKAFFFTGCNVTSEALLHGKLPKVSPTSP